MPNAARRALPSCEALRMLVAYRREFKREWGKGQYYMDIARWYFFLASAAFIWGFLVGYIVWRVIPEPLGRQAALLIATAMFAQAAVLSSGRFLVRVQSGF